MYPYNHHAQRADDGLDDSMCDLALEDNSTERPKVPTFVLGSVHNWSKRGGVSIMQQVGYFGDNDFNIGIVLDGSCRICGGRRCWHSNLLDNAPQDMFASSDHMDEETGMHHDWGWGHSQHNMPKPEFDQMLSRYLNIERDNLRLNCTSHRQIPFLPEDYTKGQRNSIAARSQGVEWCKRLEDGRLVLRDELTEDQIESGGEATYYDVGRAFLIHAGGVIPNVLVQSRTWEGDFTQFDGRDIAVFNWNNEILFTHEVLTEFLDLSCNNRMTHKGYIRAKIETMVKCLQSGASGTGIHTANTRLQRLTRKLKGQLLTALRCGDTDQVASLQKDLDFINTEEEIPPKYVSASDFATESGRAHDPPTPQNQDLLLAFLRRPSLPNIWTDAIFNFMCLLDLDYHSLFQCQCACAQMNDMSSVDSEYLEKIQRLYVVYDNSCKLLDFILLRAPRLAHYILPVIDAMHYSGHHNCSPLFNHKLLVTTRKLNAALNEQVCTLKFTYRLQHLNHALCRPLPP